MRDDLKRIYRRAYDRLTAEGNWLREKKAFRLVTTCTRRRASEFNRIPRDNFIYADDILRLYERWTANNFFKSPFGNRKLLRLALPKVRVDLKKLGMELCR